SATRRASRRSFRATFKYSSQSPQNELGDTFEGEITVQGNQYRLIMQGQEIINDGQTVWTHLIEANEVQITDQDPEQNAVMPWAIWSNYRQAYTMGRFDTHQVDKRVCNVVELVPKDDEHGLLKVVLTIAHTTKHIQCLEILDSNYTLHIFSVTNFTYDPSLDKAFFKFDPKEHQGIEIIDMR
nr:outer membrane lipoprotein carrier protein LolA [Amoebophilaceae bacterium]